jgi:hypothetical protein
MNHFDPLFLCILAAAEASAAEPGNGVSAYSTVSHAGHQQQASAGHAATVKNLLDQVRQPFVSSYIC